MDKVFISSVMRDFLDERTAAKDAVESVGLRALMAESVAASPEPSRSALLPLVEEAHALVLILGRRYGFHAESGRSPTEEEFDYAQALGRPVFAFVQRDVELEPEQDAFISRVGGGWERGAFAGFFTTPSELALGIVKALTTFREELRGTEAAPAAQARAADLAGGGRHRNAGTNAVVVALVPVGAHTLIDPLMLDQGTLGDRAADVIRQHGLVPQSAGIAARADSRGIVLTASAAHDFNATVVTLASDGAVTAEVGARAEGTMGGMAMSYPKLERAIVATSAAAQDLWAMLPSGHLVRQVAATVCIPGANNHPLSLSGQTGGSMRMPNIPTPLVAPQPAVVVRRADIATDEMNRRLAVSIKQAFADHDAVIG